jgi:hypothetical protein
MDRGGSFGGIKID